MKVLNRIYTVMLSAVMLTSATSCVNNWLDEDPSDGVNSDGAIKNSSDLESARVGLYKAFKGTSNLTDYYAQVMFVYGDVHGEDVQYNSAYGSNRGSFYYYMTYSTANEFTRTIAVWQSPYIVIGRANQIIDAAQSGNLEDATSEEATIAQYENEAKVLRAYALFDLTRVYGKPYTQDNGASLGVPIVTSILESTEKPARSTVADNYAQVLSDLNEAINSGALATSVTPGYVNKWTAEALLVRVYLTQGDYANALSTAEDIINNSPYQLWTTSQYASAWTKSNANHSNELLFELAINDNTDWTDRNGIAYLYAENGGNVPGYGDLVVTKSFADALASDPQDVRNDLLLAPANDSKNVFGDAKPYLNKFQNGGGDVRYANIPMLRLSEVYLSAAEAAFNKGDKDKAAQYLNAVISNRTTDTSLTVDASTITLDRIYIERRKELVGEGQRFFDALRRNETITRYTSDADRGWHDILSPEARSYNRDYFKALSAIPQYEINANPNMEQNPGYGE